MDAFWCAKKLTSVAVPASVTYIGGEAFFECENLTDIYYAGTEAQWKQVAVEEGNGPLASAAIHYNSKDPSSGTPTVPADTKEYIYDTPDLGEDTKLPVEALDKITDAPSAADAVKQMTNGMTSEQKSSPTGIDLATLYAETAISKAASEKGGDGTAMTIDAGDLAELARAADQAVKAVEATLSSGGITTARRLAKTVTYTTDETDISV